MGIRRIVYKYDCPNCDNPMYSIATQIGGGRMSSWGSLRSW